jgi:hypothetical protein
MGGEAREEEISGREVESRKEHGRSLWPTAKQFSSPRSRAQELRGISWTGGHERPSVIAGRVWRREQSCRVSGLLERPSPPLPWPTPYPTWTGAGRTRNRWSLSRSRLARGRSRRSPRPYRFLLLDRIHEEIPVGRPGAVVHRPLPEPLVAPRRVRPTHHLNDSRVVHDLQDRILVGRGDGPQVQSSRRPSRCVGECPDLRIGGNSRASGGSSFPSTASVARTLCHSRLRNIRSFAGKVTGRGPERASSPARPLACESSGGSIKSARRPGRIPADSWPSPQECL